MPEPGHAGLGGATPGWPAPAKHRSPATWRRVGLAALVAAVVLVHGLIAKHTLEQRMGWGAGDKPPPRIDVVFVRELAAAAPPPAAAPAPPARLAPPARRLPAVAARAAASAPQAAASATDGAAGLDQAAEPVAAAAADVAASAAAAASVLDYILPPPALPLDANPPKLVAATPPTAPPATLPPSAAALATPFNWPPSTRMNYRLSGHYRGPIEGSAQVEWLRSGSRYQVRMDTSVGPVMSRHITSEGELTGLGLAPQRFDAEQKVWFRAAKRWQLRFGPERIVLTDGREVPTLPGAQDEASQFVQLTWLFTTQPERLRVGESIEMPLAISRRLERWTYDVVAEETLYFPFGPVAAFHVKPRRDAQGGDMTPEIWIAPSLQYLPVRILIRQNPSTWVDLMLENPPMQAAAPDGR